MKNKLKEELKQAMLAKDELKTSVLRMLLSALNYFEIQKGGAGYEAKDEDVQTVIEKEVKQHRDSIEQFKNAGRQELVDKEQKELKILQGYLPEQMGEEEIAILVKAAIKETGATTMQEMGKVMAALMPKTKGKADGSLVSSLVRKELS
jgi:uncharacterized protein